MKKVPEDEVMPDEIDFAGGVRGKYAARYRTELRESNELNFARFEAKLEHRLADSDARWERRLAELRIELREVTADLLKWTFVFVAGGTLTVLGVILTVLSRS